MPCYRICGLVLQSNIPFPELIPAEREEAGCDFELLRVRAPEPEAGSWYHQWTNPDGSPWLSFARQGTGYFLRFEGMVDFAVSADGARIRCHPRDDTPPETLRHLFLDQIIPLTLSLNVPMVLHAGAVEAADGVVLFMGQTRRGKSTLTAGLSRAGFPILTDDCLRVEEREGALVGIPSYPGVRLWKDVLGPVFGELPPVSSMAHYTEKLRVSRQDGLLKFRETPLRLARAYVLALPEEVEGTKNISIVPLSHRERCIELLRHAYQMDATDPARLTQALETADRVASRLPTYRLAYRRDLALLPELCRSVMSFRES
jgi:hypothetical protein